MAEDHKKALTYQRPGGWHRRPPARRPGTAATGGRGAGGAAGDDGIIYEHNPMFDAARRAQGGAAAGAGAAGDDGIIYEHNPMFDAARRAQGGAAAVARGYDNPFVTVPGMRQILRFKQREVFPDAQEGKCHGLVLSWIESRRGIGVFGVVQWRRGKAYQEEYLRRIRARPAERSTDFAYARYTIAKIEEFQLEAVDETSGPPPMATTYLRDQRGSRVILMSLVTRRGRHTTAFYRDGGRTYFFEPNYGIYSIDENRMAELLTRLAEVYFDRGIYRYKLAAFRAVVMG